MYKGPMHWSLLYLLYLEYLPACGYATKLLSENSSHLPRLPPIDTSNKEAKSHVSDLQPASNHLAELRVRRTG